MIILIAACKLSNTKYAGIGFDDNIPWNIKTDNIHFKIMTSDRTVVIGRKTYENKLLDLSECKNIIIISNTISESTNEKITYTNDITTIPDDSIIVGGESIFELFINKATIIYMTLIDKIYNVNKFVTILDNYSIIESSHSMTAYEENCKFRLVTLKLNHKKSD